MLGVFLDLKEKLVLVVGGGPVGRRKAEAVRAAGGYVRLVCLESKPANCENADLEWRQEPYEPRHLAGVVLVFAAATTEVNARVAEDARSRGLWVNVADELAHGDFHLGASVRRGGFVVVVGTGGAAPALARHVKEQLEQQFDDAYGDWVALLAELRPAVLVIDDETRRRAILLSLADGGWMERLRREGLLAVREAIRLAHPELALGLP